MKSEQIILLVLPFEDLSLEKDYAIFCRSFSTDLTTELSRFRQFQVIAFPTHFSPHQKTAAELLDTIETDYSIQGTFRADKERIRINVQLYNRPSNQLVWGDRLEGTLSDLVELQESLLTEVVGILQQQINYDLLSSIKRKQKVTPKAYEHWLYGMDELKQGSVAHDLKARKHFEKALSIQSDYALAYSGMSLTYFNEWSCQLWDRWEVCKSGAFEWAQKAIEVDDQNYIAAMVLGKIFLYEGSYETMEYYLRKSLALNSNDPDTLIQIASYFVFLGLYDESIELYERTLKLSPLNTEPYLRYGSFIYFERGEYETAASLIVHAQSLKWADADAYSAAIFYYLKDYSKMQNYWNTFLDSYRNLISHGQDFTQAEVIEWLLHINPHRYQTRLEEFLKFISNGAFERYVAQKDTADKEVAQDHFFQKEASTWKISFEGSMIHIPEVKGFYDIRTLLSQPGQLIHCAELMGSVLDATGETLIDEKAKRQYRNKILALQTDIQEAERHSDFARLEELQDNYDRLITHLSGAMGLRGKTRKTGSPVEKARSAVTWRIRNAIAKIEQEHPALGRHLSNAIKTGTLCAYQPEREIPWITS